MSDLTAGSVDAPVRLAADGTFSYTCHRCRRCCSGKRIWVNPYEVHRLSRRLGMTTTRFIRQYTVNRGTELAVRDDLTCVFLDEHGRSVHGDRPLVCRLYPLGRLVQSGAPDRYFPVAPHPESEGVFSDAGTVAEYLDRQGAAPFLAAADRYFALLERAGTVLAEMAPCGTGVTATPDGAHDGAGASGEPGADHPGSPWLDIDAVLAAELGADGPGARDSRAPLGAEDAMALHIAALERWRQELRDALARRRDACSSDHPSDHFPGVTP